MKKNYDQFILPVFLLAVGLIALSGVELFGAALLEGAAWKQNVIFSLLLIFGMLPPKARELKATWMVAGYALAFFMFGGANIIGTVGIMLGLEKIMLLTFALFMVYRMWVETWNRNKYMMIAPLCVVVCIALLFPIQDQNIIGSGYHALKDWSYETFKSDKGFHIYLGLAGILMGISEILIIRSAQSAAPATDAASDKEQ